MIRPLYGRWGFDYCAGDRIPTLAPGETIVVAKPEQFDDPCDSWPTSYTWRVIGEGTMEKEFFLTGEGASSRYLYRAQPASDPCDCLWAWLHDGFDPFADVRLGKSLFQMRAGDWFKR